MDYGRLTKYPSTPHLPQSRSRTSDDSLLAGTRHFTGMDVVITEKLDGENATLYSHHYHARSLDSRHHPSRDWIKAFWAARRNDIPDQLFGGHEEGLGQHPDELARTWAYIHGLIRVRLENGIFTVLDATNLKASDRARVLKQLPHGVLVQYVMIDRDLDEKLADRGWRSEDLILKHHKAFKDNLPDIKNADNQGNVMVLDARQKRKAR